MSDVELVFGGHRPILNGAYPRNGQVDQFRIQCCGTEHYQAKFPEREAAMGESDGTVERKLEKHRARRDLPIGQVCNSCQVPIFEKKSNGLTFP